MDVNTANRRREGRWYLPSNAVVASFYRGGVKHEAVVGDVSSEGLGLIAKSDVEHHVGESIDLLVTLTGQERSIKLPAQIRNFIPDVGRFGVVSDDTNTLRTLIEACKPLGATFVFLHDGTLHVYGHLGAHAISGLKSAKDFDLVSFIGLKSFDDDGFDLMRGVLAERKVRIECAPVIADYLRRSLICEKQCVSPCGRRGRAL